MSYLHSLLMWESGIVVADKRIQSLIDKITKWPKTVGVFFCCILGIHPASHLYLYGNNFLH